MPDNVLPTPDAFLRGGRRQIGLERIMDVMYLSDALKTFGGQWQTTSSVLLVVFADGSGRSGEIVNTKTTQITVDALGGGAPDRVQAMVRIGDARQLVAEIPAFHGFNTTQMTMKVVYTRYNMSVWNS